MGKIKGVIKMYMSDNTMTAGELIKKLQEVSPNTPVILENEDTTGTGYTITSVLHYDKYTLICSCFETYENKRR